VELKYIYIVPTQHLYYIPGLCFSVTTSNPAAPWPDTSWLHRLFETNKMEDVSSTV